MLRAPGNRRTCWKGDGTPHACMHAWHARLVRRVAGRCRAPNPICMQVAEVSQHTIPELERVLADKDESIRKLHRRCREADDHIQVRGLHSHGAALGCVAGRRAAWFPGAPTTPALALALVGWHPARSDAPGPAGPGAGSPGHAATARRFRGGKDGAEHSRHHCHTGIPGACAAPGEEGAERGARTRASIREDAAWACCCMTTLSRPRLGSSPRRSVCAEPCLSLPSRRRDRASRIGLDSSKQRRCEPGMPLHWQSPRRPCCVQILTRHGRHWRLPSQG